MKLTHSVVICSRGREATLLTCVEKLKIALEFESVQLFIVLNGISDEEFELTKKQLTNLRLSNLNILFSNPGLAIARNEALKNINTELVTFLDDDVEVPANFFREIDDVMVLAPIISGLAPRISGLFPKFSQKNSNTFLQRYLQKRKFGRLTSFGNNYWIPDDPDFQEIQVDWLPGCSMTYRTSRIKNMQFETALMNGPTGGYSLGEDVEFSNRVGNLFAIPSISIKHSHETSIRDNSFIMAKAKGRWIAYLVRNKRHEVSGVKSLLWMTLSLGFHFLADIKNPKYRFYKSRNKIIQILYYFKEFIKPELILKNE